MDFGNVTVAKCAVSGLAVCLAATEVPLPEPLGTFAQAGTVGLALFLIWWIIAKTVPSFIAQLNRMAEAHAAQLKQFQEGFSSDLKQILDALKK